MLKALFMFLKGRVTHRKKSPHLVLSPRGWIRQSWASAEPVAEGSILVFGVGGSDPSSWAIPLPGMLTGRQIRRRVVRT